MRGFDRKLAAVVGAIVAVGCTAPKYPRVVTDPDPAVKIPAYGKAVRESDRSGLRQMIKDLESDDPAVRLYSIEALEKLTGESFGYLYYDDEFKRAEAIKKWEQWLNERDAPTSVPTAVPSTRSSQPTQP